VSTPSVVLPMAVLDAMCCADLGKSMGWPCIMALGEPGMTSPGPAGAAVVTVVICGAALMLLAVLLLSTKGPAPAGSASGSMTLPPTGCMHGKSTAVQIRWALRLKYIGYYTQCCLRALHAELAWWPCKSNHSYFACRPNSSVRTYLVIDIGNVGIVHMAQRPRCPCCCRTHAVLPLGIPGVLVVSLS
jgi:hypothetical protein